MSALDQALDDAIGRMAMMPPPSNPVAVARALVDEFGWERDSVPVLHRWHGDFFEWHDSCWKECDDAAVRSRIYRQLEYAVYLDKELKPWAPTRHKVSNVIDALGAVTHLPGEVDPPAWLADHPFPAGEFVSVANGLLHVASRTLLDHTPRFFNRVAVPFDYDPNAPAPKHWLAFLDTLWPDDHESQDLLAEYSGYVLSGRTDLHKILLMVGPTRAGKGVIARTLQRLVGRGNYCGPSLASLERNFGLQPLLGKSLAVISDARLSGRGTAVVVERLLSISGEDTMIVDRKYKEPWSGKLPTRLLVCSNELPKLGDASAAITNRFVTCVLTKSWLGKEKRTLEGQFEDELPGILNWALDGLTRLQANGRFSTPKASVDAAIALEDLASPVRAFLRDRCTVGPTQEVGTADLYDAYKDWCEHEGAKPATATVFGRDLRSAQPGIRKTRPRGAGTREHSYRGVGLQPDPTDDALPW